ncbi:MAG: SDR family NAD(P)-dependent oxidoreductase [Myxococcales bacterium]
MDKTGLCVVTGASSGIGKALAEALAAAGYRVLGTSRKPPAPPVGSSSAPQAFEWAALDLTLADSVEALARSLADRNERISLLVNNAGYAAMGPLAALGRNELERQFQANLIGPLSLTAALLPRMSRGSVVVDIGSVSGEVTTPFAGAYCASKAALHAADDALRMELEPLGVHVVSVRAGGVRSSFGQQALERAFKPPAGSPFAPFAKGIEARAMESQKDAMAPELLAALLLRALERKVPPRVFRVGPRSWSLPLLERLLPGKVLDRVLQKKYGLR